MRINLFIALYVFFNLPLFGQQDLTLFQFSGIPQNNLVNPASMPDDKIVIGLPVLSSVNGVYNNRAFALNDGLLTEEGILVIDPELLISKLDKINFLNLQAQDQWFLFGYKLKDNYFQISISEKAAVDFAFPKKLFDFILQGNANFLGERVSIEKLGFNAINYREISLGYVHQLNNKWQIGGHFNLLFGLANIRSKNSSIGIYTDPENYNITVDGNIEVNTSGLNSIQGNTTDYLKQGGNFGVGIDLGAIFRPNEKWEISTSLIDLGMIWWKNDLNTYTNNYKTFTLTGIDIKDFVYDNNLDGDSLLTDIGDSLKDVFSLEEIEKKYSTSLSPKWYGGAKYYINHKNRVYASTNLQFYSSGIRFGFSAGYELDLNKFLGLTANYSIYNNSFSNFGFGLRGRLGPVQLYVMSDNLLASFNLYDYKSVHIRFGINLLFGDVNKPPVKNNLL